MEGAVGGVGAGMLHSAASGWKLFSAQLLTQITLMALLRHAWEGRAESVEAAGGETGDRPIRAAVWAILTICGYMTLFGALSAVLGAWVGEGSADALLCLLDVPSGALRVAGMALREDVRLPLLAGMCNFGGLCVIAQSLGALKGCGVSPWEYGGVRVLAGLIGAGYMALLQKLPFPAEAQYIGAMWRKPLAAGALVTAVLAAIVLRKYRKPIS